MDEAKHSAEHQRCPDEPVDRLGYSDVGPDDWSDYQHIDAGESVHCDDTDFADYCLGYPYQPVYRDDYPEFGGQRYDDSFESNDGVGYSDFGVIYRIDYQHLNAD